MAGEKALIGRLIQCNVFQVGEFILKGGESTPVYIDLRKIISFPDILKSLADSIYSKQLAEDLKPDVVCGVPYTAIPIVSAYSVIHNIPLVMKRKEEKNYGTKRMIEGTFHADMSCLIIEDTVCSGLSVIETALSLRKEGFIVTDCISVVNRNQGAPENLAKEGIVLHSLFDVDDLFSHYCSVNEVDNSLIERIKKYLCDNKFIPATRTE